MTASETKFDAILEILTRLEERLTPYFPTPIEQREIDKRELEQAVQLMKANGITVTQSD